MDRSENSAAPLEWSDELVARFWDHFRTREDLYFSQRLSAPVLARFRRYLPPGQRVLDLGCGPGFFLEALLKAGYRVAGVDFSPKSVESAQTRCRAYPNFLGAQIAGADTFEDGRFDAAFSLEVIEHLTDDHLAGLYRDAMRRLRPGGLFILTTPNEEDLDASTVYCACCDHTFHRWQHIRTWSQTTLAASLQKAGFELVEVGATAFAHSLPVRAAVSLVQTLGWPVKLSANKAKPNLFAVARKPG